MIILKADKNSICLKSCKKYLSFYTVHKTKGKSNSVKHKNALFFLPIKMSKAIPRKLHFFRMLTFKHEQLSHNSLFSILFRYFMVSIKMLFER